MVKTIVMVLFLMFSSITLALTEAEGDRILQCTLKGVEFGLIWEAEHSTRNWATSGESAISVMTAKLKQDGAPQRIIDVWSQQAVYALEYEDRYKMLNDIVFECVEVGY